jgi:hypothetical protein
VAAGTDGTTGDTTVEVFEFEMRKQKCLTRLRPKLINLQFARN